MHESPLHHVRFRFVSHSRKDFFNVELTFFQGKLDGFLVISVKNSSLELLNWIYFQKAISLKTPILER